MYIYLFIIILNRMIIYDAKFDFKYYIKLKKKKSSYLGK